MTSPNTDNRLVPKQPEGRVVIDDGPISRLITLLELKELANEKFYDGVVFHRVIEGFMAQTGDPTGTGRHGSGKNLKAEFSNEPHVRGTVSMARANHPDSADSQFFICFDDATFLDGKYTVWGKVIEGMESIDKIKRGEPVKDPDKIITMRVGDAV